MSKGRFGLSTLAAALFGLLAAGAFATAVQAAPAKADAAAKGPEITAESRQAGMKAAPALVQAASLPCQVADARMIGKTTDPKTKKDQTYYEVACKGSMGFIVVDSGKDAAPTWAACPDQAKIDPVSGKPSGAACFLPANMDDTAQIAPFVAKSGVPCQVAKARGIGHSPKVAYFEVACSDGRGYVVQTSSPPSLDQKVNLITCLAFSDPTSPVACKLTSTDSQLAAVDQLAAKSGKNCTIAKKRYVLTTEQGSNYFEVACSDGKGYMLEAKADGSLGEVIGCAEAEGIGDGCTYTNGRAAQTEEAGLYSKLAHSAGFPCDVSKYSPFEVNVPGHEVVELACSNRPDGGVAVLPVSSGAGNAIVYDCIHSQVAGYRCSFTSADAALPTLTSDLKSLGKTSCVVSGQRFIARTTTKQGYVEVACADGAPGYIIEYSAPDLAPVKPTQAIPCVSASEIEGGCTLPTNQKKG